MKINTNANRKMNRRYIIIIGIILCFFIFGAVNAEAEDNKTVILPSTITGDTAAGFDGGTCPAPYKDVIGIDIVNAFIGENREYFFVAIPKGRFITFSFPDSINHITEGILTIETTGADGATGQVSALLNDNTEQILGSIRETQTTQITTFSLDQECIRNLKAIKIEGTNNAGQYDGVDVVSIYIEYDVEEAFLVFNCNKGYCDIDKKPIKYGEKYGTLPTPTRDGYAFKGWYTKKTSGKRVTKDTVCKSKKSKTVYAQWIKTYKVKYNLNGGKGSIKSQTKKKGKNLKLSTKKPTRSGYIFKGWSVKKNGAVKYKAGATYKADKSATLYAKWSKKEKKSTDSTKTFEKKQFKAVSLNKSSLTLKKGETYTLIAKGPNDIKWVSSNSKVAKVNSKGEITAKDVGIANITAYSESEKNNRKVCKVKVNYNQKNNKLKSEQIVGKFRDGEFGKEFTYSARYTDDYFLKNDSTVLQKDFAKFAMLASACVYDKKDNYKGYAEKLLKGCGYKVYPHYERKIAKDDNDYVHYVIGTKEVNGVTIVAILIKGTSGNYEWVSNFEIGQNRVTHLGFGKAEERLYDEIKEYIENKNVKIWITGHSRGGAVANLLARRLTDLKGRSNVYAYTFATPRVSTDAVKSGYQNIKNFLNPGDFVTEVAPEAWGYKRFGQDIYLSADKKAGMNQLFKNRTGVSYQGYGKKGKESLINAFLKYAGDGPDSYYQLRFYKGNLSAAPATFCKQGLGYFLAGDNTGLAYIASIIAVDDNAREVFSKMAIDGKVLPKFGQAHCQMTYLCWLDSMD